MIIMRPVSRSAPSFLGLKCLKVLAGYRSTAIHRHEDCILPAFGSIFGPLKWPGMALKSYPYDLMNVSYP